MSNIIFRAAMAAAAFSLFIMPIQAQDSTTMPPSRVITIRYEELKPGAAYLHDKLETQYVSLAPKTSPANYRMSLSSVTGPEAALRIDGFDSYAAVEESRRRVENNDSMRSVLIELDERHGQLLTGARTMIAAYREDLSYRPDIDPGQIRYIKVFTVRVRPGHESDYAESIKLVLQIAKADIHWSMYQVKSGAPDGTFLVLMSIKTIGDMDIDPGRDKYVAGALSPENRARVQKLSSESYTMEMAIFAASPDRTFIKK